MRHQTTNSEFYLSPAAIARIIAHAGSVRNRLIVALLAFTGMRRAEVRCLHWEDFDWQVRRLHIRNGKGGKYRIVFLPTELDALIGNYRASSDAVGPLFPGRRGAYLSLRTINNIVGAAGRHAAIENPNPRYRNINPHLFRHSVARNWKNECGSMEALQKLLGHASVRTTLDLYGTQSIDDVQENYERMVAKLVEPARKSTKPEAHG